MSARECYLLVAGVQGKFPVASLQIQGSQAIKFLEFKVPNHQQAPTLLRFTAVQGVAFG
jgi:hypothetical protein